MLKITEKRTFRIPPCKIDRELVRDIGKILEKETPEIRKRMITDVIRGTDFKSEEKAREYLDEIAANQHLPVYVLEAKSRDVRSRNIDHFIDTKWPKDTSAMQLSLGGGIYAEETEIRIALFLEYGKMKESRGSVSGTDATWVHGIADQIEEIFRNKRLGYAPFVEKGMLRSMIFFILLLVAFGVTHYYVLPVAIEDNLSWIVMYFIVGILFLEYLFRMLYPRFEFGEAPLPKKIRKWILAAIAGSGIISAIILKFLGLS